MGRLSAWFRGRAGLLLACLLVVFALTPALDAMICEVDASPAAHAVMGDLAHADHQDSGHGDSQGACIHGHCHHASSQAPEPLLIAATARVERERYGLVLTSVPVADRHFRLIRPPRA